MEREPDRRLHPVSLLLNLGATLKDLLVPLVVALFFARSDAFRLIVPGLIALIAGGTAVFKYLTYSYRYDEDDLVVREGMFFRNERHIPYNRIQNIDAVQNVVHRLFDVAVVQVQTGSSAEPEATMNVLPMRALAEMRQRVLVERRQLAAPEGADVTVIEAPARPAPRQVLHLPPRELIIAGFIENRGLALVAAAFGILAQSDMLEDVIRRVLPKERPAWLENVVPDAVPSATAVIGGIVMLVLFALIVVRILSTLWTLIRLHDFTLVRDGNDLRAQYGLFTRVTATIPVQRVQTISIHQRWLHRRFHRAAIRVTTAGASGIPGEEKAAADREWLAPIVPVNAVRSLLHEIDPALELGDVQWMGAHPRAALRLTRVYLIVVALITAALAVLFSWWSLAIGVVLCIFAVLRARGTAASLGTAILGHSVAFRSGWLHQVVSVARFERIQSASWFQSFLDRRNAMARISVDTAGMGESGLGMGYLPEAAALELHTRLSQSAAAKPFTW